MQNCGRTFTGFVAVTILTLSTLLTLVATDARAHSGGRDSYGCHNNSTLNVYECHAGVFAGRSWPNPGGKDAMVRELNPPTEDSLVTQLKAQVAVLQEEIAALRAAHSALSTQYSALKAELEALKNPPPSPPPPSPPPPSSPVILSVLGDPLTGPWSVEAVVNDPRDVMVEVRIDGTLHHVENEAPYTSFGDSGGVATRLTVGAGSHRLEFIAYLQGMTTEIGRASIVVVEGSSPTSGTATLTWKANTEPDLAGYKVHIGTSSCAGVGTLFGLLPCAYPKTIPIGTVTQYQVTDLVPGTAYYFAVTAVDGTGNESGYSNEASKAIP